MPYYRRAFVPGGCYFFTLVTRDRANLFDEATVSILREALKREKQRRPFEVQAMVVLPDHLHCLWLLPAGDSDYPARWREIKKHLSKCLARSVWQPRYWEHSIRDAHDWRLHVDYIHYNPVRHGYVDRAEDWPWSSFGRWQAAGLYPVGWGEELPLNLGAMELE